MPTNQLWKFVTYECCKNTLICMLYDNNSHKIIVLIMYNTQLGRFEFFGITKLSSGCKRKKINK